MPALEDRFELPGGRSGGKVLSTRSLSSPMVARRMDYRSRVRRLFLEAIVLMLGATIFFLAAVAPRGGIDTGTAINSVSSNEEACEAESQAVQGALHLYMFDMKVDTVPVVTEPTNDMSSPVPLFSTISDVNRFSTWAYTWDSKGTVRSISSMANGPWVPEGCYPSGYL
jgi:hypothetical protein